MKDRKRVSALGLMCVASIVCARSADASSTALLQVAPLVYDGIIAHDVHGRAATPQVPAFVAASPARRPVALIPLYGAFAALQGADAHSTRLALRHGGHETNPLMSGVAGSPAGLAAVKLAATVSTIAAAETLWRSHPRIAVIAMAIITSGYSVVVARNYRVAR